MKITAQSNIYIICPANNSTGGTEALHQLCHKLRTVFNYKVGIFYVDKTSGKNPKPEVYAIYNTEETDKISDNKEDILIIPESLTQYIYKYNNIQKIVWWLSVDFYAICMKNRHRGVKFYWSKYILGKEEDKEYLLTDLPDVYHWAQSHRAYLYLTDRGIPKDKIKKVCDYMNPLFLERAGQDILHKEKQDIIIYNPKKGKKEIKSIRKKCTEFLWIPIRGMTPLQVSGIMKKAKLYIDFGFNPGRDRMLRESTLMKCVIISGKNGSSKYQEDLNIPEKYKFEYSKSAIPEIVNKIREVLAGYETYAPDFNNYTQEILKEEHDFEDQLKSIFN
ncbi:MAG: hypothetical protein LBQ84_03945 [Flavobacteriaceae bacterium]|jgi:hypothetical protein|nr:hypothetical protein [Flavobacteriaceae bacterium]